MIEVGEYVRTKRGIAKVLEVKTVKTKMYGKHDVAYRIDKCPRMYITETEFIKHSKDIIDLIEVGDYVNGHLARAIYLDGARKYIKLDNSCSPENNFTGIRTYKKEIKTILTKEQYMQNCYKIDTNQQT